VSLPCYGAVNVKGSVFVTCYFVTIGSRDGVAAVFSKDPHLGGAKADTSNTGVRQGVSTGCGDCCTFRIIGDGKRMLARLSILGSLLLLAFTVACTQAPPPETHGTDVPPGKQATTLSVPVNVSVTPKSGSGASQVFTATYSDAMGYQDISQAMFMVAADAGGVSACAVQFDTHSNNFTLGNDAARVWQGPITGGSSDKLQNSQCVLSGATSSGSGSGNTLTVHFGISFKSGFTGMKNTYLLVYGSAGNSGWQTEGTWTP
jgi:hypothetical protein